MAIAPPILCKHPMLETIESLAGNATLLQKMIDDIEAGGAAATRLGKIENDGLLGRYSDVQKTHAHAQLLGGWGDESTLVHISNMLGTALVKVRDSSGKRPLRAWWLVGATENGVRCAVTEDATAVYFLLLTPPLDDDAVASKAAFDTAFLNALKTQSGAFKEWTDSL
jgi:hypothetical protein